MPSTYAHYCFGKAVLSKLSENLQRIVFSSRALYDIGLHGPDLLFYYHPLTANRINAIGYGMHERPAGEFFGPARSILKKAADQDAAAGYLLGFLCHFVLDSQCHTYINQKIRESGISHTEIEVEFDRMLMVRDGLDPLRHALTRHILPSRCNAEIIQQFFPPVTVQQVEKALRSMVWYNNLLLAPGKLKRSLIYGILKLSGNAKEMSGLLVNYEPNPSCQDSCKRLNRLFEQGVEIAAELLPAYWDSIQNGTPLPSRMTRTFGAE